MRSLDENVRGGATEALAGIAMPSEDYRLTGRHIVVTGGGRGLGQGIAASAAIAGALVTIIARSGAQLDETAQLIAEAGGLARPYPLDLSDTSAFRKHLEVIVERNGPIDGVVHAAGVQVRKKAVELTVDDWRFVQTMNLEAPFFLSQEIARMQLDEKRAGSHVFIGSLNSTIGLAGVAPYAASKTGLLGAARSLSTEWSGRGVRANVIGPGYFHTAMTDGLLSQASDHERILGRIPMGRLGDPADVGGLAVFLLSDASRYITGQLINVDGGWLAS
ncbi:SDR family NAD(P)-dependent oxidoreductase [Homoserinimonas sp. OAct 916]|uniref:SDR family NAD(P)-dependent oxidoreductase n=1 Tax=Homoserinimonas sp. OAct 916 TaxID=2211450 RepID=UPI0018E59CE2|nr:SDR family oxidoreductase [Homoserinimonas sp. OAct 916]